MSVGPRFPGGVLRILLAQVGVRHLWHEWPRTSLTLLGVALGVGVLVSVRLANQSALASFSGTVDSVAGRANLEVRGGGEGFDERLWPVIRNSPGVLAAAPSVQVHALAKPGGVAPVRSLEAGQASPYPETVLVLGVDALSESPFGRGQDAHLDRERVLALAADPRAVAVARPLADRHGLKAGDSITVLASGEPVTLRIARVLEAHDLRQAFGGNVLVMDIAGCQEMFHRFGRLDNVDLIVDPARRDSVAASLRARLPSGLEVDSPQGRTRQVENMVRAFQLNLSALSFIALFVAAFLIHNAISLAVLRRRAEIGVLRALGVTEREVLGLFLAEGLGVGLAGSLLGLALGTLLARGMLGAIARTLSDLYLVAQAKDFHPDPATYAVGLVLGVGTALVSSVLPAREAARTPPATTVRQGAWREPGRRRIPRWTLAGALTLALAAATAWGAVQGRAPLGGFVAAFLVLIGFTLLAPGFTLLVERLAGPTLRRVFGIEAALGARYLREGVARTGVVVAALMVSVGMMVALAIMVGSFRRTVDLWVGQTIRGDLYVEPAGHRSNASATSLPDGFVDAVRALPGVAGVDTYRGTRVRYGDRLAFVAGVDFGVQERFGRLRFMAGAATRILRRARERGGVIVTESFSRHHRLAVGDSVEIAGARGLVRFPIEGVFYDYSTDAGGVMMDVALYQRVFATRRTESLALFLAPGSSPARIREQVIERAGPGVVLYVSPNQSLRRQVLKVFDQTFQITGALQAIAVLVAVLGLVTTLTTLVLQRGREIGILRAAGALERQIRTMVLVESGLLGLIGTLLGCACGTVLALLLVHVIHRQFFGWTIRLELDPWVYARTLALFLATSLIAGLWPARLAARRVAAESMRID